MWVPQQICRLIALMVLLACASVATAQPLPALTGRVIDNADMLAPTEETAIAAKLEALEGATTRQLVVVTVPDLQGLTVEDYAFELGEKWKLGNQEADNGAILLIARAERKIRIEVGDGLEPILPDAMTWMIIRDSITPRFKTGDFPGGITAGVDALIQQLQAPPEQAEANALKAAREQADARTRGGSNSGNIPFSLIFWGIIIFFFILPMFRRGGRGRRYRRGGFPVILWGPGFGGGGGSWGSSGGGFGGFGGGGGGFSGGGGSFGGGGASGDW